MKSAWAAAITVVAVATIWVAPGAARRLVVEVPLRKCGLLVVPGGGARERISTAADLMEGGACSALLITGTREVAKASGETVHLMDLDPALLIPPPAVSRSTVEDAEVALRAAREGGFRSVLVVTSPYHTRRAEWVFASTFKGSGIEVGILPSAAFYMDYDRWWESSHGRWAVLGEYSKLWMYGLILELAGMGASSAGAPAG